MLWKETHERKKKEKEPRILHSEPIPLFYEVTIPLSERGWQITLH
jgi:hypothetical protein